VADRRTGGVVAVKLLTGLFVLLAVAAIVLLAYAFSMRAEMY
jgi:hypothetical protein